MKKLFLSLILINFAFLSFALPGFTSFIPDKPGEFVYYRDSSFSRESYIGILCYDNTSYQIRYYAPQTSNAPEKIVAALFTIDPAKDHFEMTGENIVIADYANAEDVDIVNYLHDILYEFSSRRCRLGELTPATEGYKNNLSLIENGLSVSSDFPQFGGDVTIIYDCMIPFFNVKRIENNKGEPIFECVELGLISSSDDTLFDTFVKVPDTGKIKINSVKPKKAPALTAKLGNQNVSLDETWKQSMENMWTQSDDAIVTLAVINATAPADDFVNYSLIRMLLESKDGYHINLDKCDVIFGKDQIRIYSDSYIKSSQKVYFSTKYLTANKGKTYDYLSFATTKANYLMKRSYYDKILKSYSN